VIQSCAQAGLKRIPAAPITGQLRGGPSYPISVVPLKIDLKPRGQPNRAAGPAPYCCDKTGEARDAQHAACDSTGRAAHAAGVASQPFTKRSKRVAFPRTS
jgi:hypothetical protein